MQRNDVNKRVSFGNGTYRKCECDEKCEQTERYGDRTSTLPNTSTAPYISSRNVGASKYAWRDKFQKSDPEHFELWLRVYNNYLRRYYERLNTYTEIPHLSEISFEDFCEFSYLASSQYISPYA
jgi:hypothetical protein